MHTKTAPSAKIVRRVALALAVTVAAAGLVLASLGTAQAFTKGDRKATNGGTTGAAQPATLVDHGGAVLADPRVHVIWWGQATAFPADVRTTVGGVLSALDGSAHLALAAQYLRGATPHVTYSAADDWADATTAPAAATFDDVAAEVARYLAATGTTPDPDGIYVVLSTRPATGTECAWHITRTVTTGGSAALVRLAYVPDGTGSTRCAVSTTSTVASRASLSAAASTVHEILETMADPIPGATWTDAAGHEIVDPCAAWVGDATLRGGLVVPLQRVWDNAGQVCAAG